MFYRETQKVIAQNHQFLGVNNAFEQFKRRRELGGKLGVFWHTQGSGKSFSMVFYTRKIFRKLTGNFTFVVVTDRDDLDGQIYRNFLHTGVVAPKDDVRPTRQRPAARDAGQEQARGVHADPEVPLRQGQRLSAAV